MAARLVISQEFSYRQAHLSAHAGLDSSYERATSQFCSLLSDGHCWVGGWLLEQRGRGVPDAKSSQWKQKQLEAHVAGTQAPLLSFTTALAERPLGERPCTQPRRINGCSGSRASSSSSEQRKPASAGGKTTYYLL